MYTTLARVKNELKATTTQTADDALLLTYIDIVTRRIREIASGVSNASIDFEPQYATKYFTAANENVNTWLGTLNLNDYLLLPTSITVDGTAYIWLTDIFPYPQTYRWCIRSIRWSDSSGLQNTWYPTTRTRLETIAITGYWGIKDRYTTKGWLTGDTIQDVGGISASSSTVTVNNASGTDSLGRSPRFSPGNLLMIDSEMVEVESVSTNTLTIQRAMNGTAAAAHLQNAAITIFEIEPPIVRAATRWVAQTYARRGAFEQITVTDVATTVFPADAPREVYGALNGYANV